MNFFQEMEAETLRRMRDPAFLTPPEGGMISQIDSGETFLDIEEDEEDA